MDKSDKIINDLAEEFCLVGDIENILINPSTTENKIKDIFKIIESERLKRADNELGFILGFNDKTHIVEYIKGRHEQVIEMRKELEANDD